MDKPLSVYLRQGKNIKFSQDSQASVTHERGRKSTVAKRPAWRAGEKEKS